MPTPYVPKPKTKKMKCRYCPGMITVGWKTKKSPAHIACTLKYMAEYQTQMHNHSGPLYDKWLDAMRRAFADPGTGTHPSPENVNPGQDVLLERMMRYPGLVVGVLPR